MQTTARQRNWLGISLWAVVLIWLITTVAAADRSFWYDEVYTLGAAGINGELDRERLMQDVHPPVYVLMVHALSMITEGNLFALRLVNLIGMAALLAGLWLMRGGLERDRFRIAAILLIGNYLCLYLTVELRSYFIIYGLAVLMQALLLRRLQGRHLMDIPLILIGIAATGTHFFGAALACAILGTSTLQHLMARRIGRAALPALGAVTCLGLTALWVFGLSSVTGAMGGNLWITNSPDHYLTFLFTQPLLMLLALAVLVTRRQHAGEAATSDIGWMLLPGAAVLTVALLIGLHTPVITARNLLVLAPGLVTALALWTPGRLLTAMAASPLVLLAVIVLSGNEALKAARNQQHIAWAVTQANAPGCQGVPIYTMTPDVIDRFAQRVFTGSVQRPPRDILELQEGFDPVPYAECPLIMGWHERGGVDNVEAFLTQLGIPHRIRLPDDPQAQSDRLATHGFIVDLGRDPGQD